MGRAGALVAGVVRGVEGGDGVLVDLDGGIASVLPEREQTPGETYRPGERIVALVKAIAPHAHGPQLVLSRADTALVVKLFEEHVPEIRGGIVVIVRAAREPGARTKIAVTSRSAAVDPVAACVGTRGSRVHAVVQELRGEKIDVVPFDADPARFARSAVAPAHVSRVTLDEQRRSMELVVPDAERSLAHGRRGLNVRLASALTGWKLDIVGEPG